MTKSSGITFYGGRKGKTYTFWCCSANVFAFDTAFEGGVSDTRAFVFYVNGASVGSDVKGNISIDGGVVANFELTNPAIGAPYLTLMKPDYWRVSHTVTLDEDRSERFEFNGVTYIATRNTDKSWYKDWTLLVDAY